MAFQLGDTVPIDVTGLDESIGGIRLVWIDSGSRLIYATGESRNGAVHQSLIDRRPNDTAILVHWGLVTVQGIRTVAGQYLPYPPADGIPITNSPDPTNQVPHLREFLKHCCTFAHEVLSAHEPHAPRLRHVDSWNLAPDIALDVDSIEKNRIGMRYYRGVLGYYFDQLDKFEAMPGDADRRGQFEEDWRVELPILQALDRYVCGECQDEAGGSRLRDFIHYCNVSEWDSALTVVERLAIGNTIQYRARLPKINRSNPDDLRPHTSQHVRTWVTNVPSVDSGWRSMMRDFDAAVKRYDRDPSVRMSVGTHVP